jgi:hypothetical protein
MASLFSLISPVIRSIRHCNFEEVKLGDNGKVKLKCPDINGKQIEKEFGICRYYKFLDGNLIFSETGAGNYCKTLKNCKITFPKFEDGNNDKRHPKLECTITNENGKKTKIDRGLSFDFQLNDYGKISPVGTDTRKYIKKKNELIDEKIRSVIKEEDSIESENKKFSLKLEKNGSLVLYEHFPSEKVKIWSSNTNKVNSHEMNKVTKYRAILLQSGEFLIIDSDGSVVGNILPAKIHKLRGHDTTISPDSRLFVENDGKVGFYGTDKNGKIEKTYYKDIAEVYI